MILGCQVQVTVERLDNILALCADGDLQTYEDGGETFWKRLHKAMRFPKDAQTAGMLPAAYGHVGESLFIAL